jgi:GNAT superfamily N-acetyltransferase
MALLPSVGDCGAVKILTELSRIQIELVRLKSFAMSDADQFDSISLRLASAEDAMFLLELYKSSRGDDLRELGWEKGRISEFLEMQHEAQQRFHENEYKRPTDQVVLREGQPIGRVFFERRDHEIRCVDIALLPEYRNAGVGAFLIRQLQADAKRDKKPLRLQVIRFSRAVGLFERLGFVRVSETGTHFQMEWTPES